VQYKISPLLTTNPISRTSPAMGDRDDRDFVDGNAVKHEIGESMNGALSQIISQCSSRTWQLLNSVLGILEFG